MSTIPDSWLTAWQWARDPAEFASLSSLDGPSTVLVTAPTPQVERDRVELGFRVADELEAEACAAEWAEIEAALADDAPEDFA